MSKTKTKTKNWKNVLFEQNGHELKAKDQVDNRVLLEETEPEQNEPEENEPEETEQEETLSEGELETDEDDNKPKKKINKNVKGKNKNYSMVCCFRSLDDAEKGNIQTRIE